MELFPPGQSGVSVHNRVEMVSSHETDPVQIQSPSGVVKPAQELTLKCNHAIHSHVQVCDK